MTRMFLITLGWFSLVTLATSSTSVPVLPPVLTSPPPQSKCRTDVPTVEVRWFHHKTLQTGLGIVSRIQSEVCDGG